MMKVQLASIFVTLGFFSFASCQSSLSGLPGLAQWQRHMRQHSVAEGRSEPQLALDSQRGLWQSQIKEVKDAENRLGKPVSVNQVQTEETFEENKEEDRIENILKKIRERTKFITEEPAVFRDKEEKLDQNEIENILTEEIGTKSGLKEIIKQLIRSKLEKLKAEDRKEKSPLEILLDSSEQTKTVVKNDNRPVSFLDKLSAIYIPNTEAPETFAYYDDYDENEEKEEELEEEEVRSLESLFSSEYEDFDSFIESDRRLEGRPFIILDDFDTKDNQIDLQSSEDVELFTTEEDIAKNFLVEERDSVQSDTKILMNEMENMLAQLEADAIDDNKLVDKTLEVIKAKLQSSSTQDLLADSDFKNSVFYRFAIMKLPLRGEDIPVAELSEIKKVIRNNIINVTEETRELLKEMKKDVNDQNNDNEEERAKRIDVARKQLQKLLEIVSPLV